MKADERACAAVLELVAEQGLAAVTVAALIVRAEITREDFYWHFPSKFACYAAALRAAAASEPPPAQDTTRDVDRD
jgi:AcrR family transcriptional regulator